MFSLLLRGCTARGSGTRFSLAGPTMVKACKSFPFKKSSLVMKIKTPCLVLLLHINSLTFGLSMLTLHFGRFGAGDKVFKVLGPLSIAK